MNFLLLQQTVSNPDKYQLGLSHSGGKETTELCLYFQRAQNCVYVVKEKSTLFMFYVFMSYFSRSCFWRKTQHLRHITDPNHDLRCTNNRLRKFDLFGQHQCDSSTIKTLSIICFRSTKSKILKVMANHLESFSQLNNGRALW